MSAICTSDAPLSPASARRLTSLLCTSVRPVSVSPPRPEAQGELGRRMRHGACPAVLLQKGGERHEGQVPGDFPGIVQDAPVRRKADFFPDRAVESGHQFREAQAQGLTVSGIRHVSLP